MSGFSPTADSGEHTANPRSILILQLTDFHFLAEGGTTLLGVDTEHSFSSVLAAALESRSNPDVALLTGDLAQDAEASAYARLKKRLAALPCPGYCLPGNHDDPNLIASILTDGNVHVQQQILLDRWQIVCLDSTVPHRPHGRLAEDQLTFLKTALDQQPQRFALVALHHHPVPCGSPWMDTMMLENADRLFDILETRRQARGVVFGHIHQTMDVVYRGLRLFGTPSTCFQFKPNQAEFALDPIPPGYRWIELHPDGRLDTEVGHLSELPARLDFMSQGY